MARHDTSWLRPALRTAALGAELSAAATLLGEMTVAAQTTIAFRLARLAEAATDPATLTDPEFQRMGWEKLETATAAGAAMATGWREVHDGLWDWGSKQAEATEKATLSLLFARHPGDVAAAQNAFAEATLDAAEMAADRFALATSRLATLGLHPYHRATRSNAKRLHRLARRRRKQS